MFKLLLLSVLTHHSDAADPDLLRWIKGVLDHVVTGPWLAVAMLGVVVVAIPAAIVIFYVIQQRRASPGVRQTIRSR